MILLLHIPWPDLFFMLFFGLSVFFLTQPCFFGAILNLAQKTKKLQENFPFFSLHVFFFFAQKTTLSMTQNNLMVHEIKIRLLCCTNVTLLLQSSAEQYLLKA